jgi:hypothetical protein
MTAAPSMNIASYKDARLYIEVINEAQSSGGYGVQNIGGATGYKSVVLTLSNATLLTANQTKTVDIADPTTSVAAAFKGLKTGNGYNLAISLKDAAAGAGSQVGNGERRNFTLAAGVNAITVIVSADGSLKITEAGANKITDGKTIVIGDKVNFNSGFAAAETGVSEIHMEFDADMYGAATTVATKSADFNAFSNFDTSATTATYDATKLKVTTTGDVTFKLLDANGVEVGRSVLSGVIVEAGATIDVTLQ